MEHPELIRTPDNPHVGELDFEFTEDYSSLDQLEESNRTRRSEIDLSFEPDDKDRDGIIQLDIPKDKQD